MGNNNCCGDERDFLKKSNEASMVRIDGVEAEQTISKYRLEAPRELSIKLDEFGAKSSTGNLKINIQIFDELNFPVSPTVKDLISKYGLFGWEEPIDSSINVFKITNVNSEYIGQMKGSKKHGRGYLIKQSGDLWASTFEDDVADGLGAVYFNTGDYFEGDISKGETKKGRMVFMDGRYYIGEFMTDGYMNGKGKLFDDNAGTVYEGIWSENMKEGEGHLFQKERWINGVKVQRPEFGLDSNRSQQ